MIEILLFVIGGLFLWLLVKSKKMHNYWRERSVPYVKPLPLIGNSLKTLTFQVNFPGLLKEIHKNNPDHPYIGIYQFTKPSLLIRDPIFLGNILIKDFNHFVNRGVDDMKKTEVDHGLFFLAGDEWRAVRYKMVPGFTTGKLRHMFPGMYDCAKRLIPLIDNCSKDVDIVKVSTPYTMSIIGSCIFGIDIETGENSKFRQMGENFFEMSYYRYFQFLLFFISPKLAEKFGFSFTPVDISKYFSGIINDTFRYRIENNVVRNDFVQTLLQLKEKGTVEIQTRDSDDNYLYDKISASTTKNFEMTNEILVSQAFTFINAGFEVVNLTIQYALLEMSLNTEVQSRAREEVDHLITKHGGMNFEVLREASFLSYCIDETTRMYPLAQVLLRVCTKRYEIEEGIFIEPGTKVSVSLDGLHRDPSLWQNPDKFDPDRWQRDHIVPHSFMPFGDGPRMCIGMRFAIMEVKLALAVILHNYKVHLSSMTQVPLKMEKLSIITKPVNPVYFNFEKIRTEER